MKINFNKIPLLTAIVAILQSITVQSANAQNLIQANGFGGLCLDITNPDNKEPQNGAQVLAWPCHGRHGGANQKFQLNNNVAISNASPPQVSSINSFLPVEISGTLKGHGRNSMGGGYAEADATFYRNGLIVIQTHAVSSSYTSGTKGSVFVVGSDRKGRALFASQVFDIPTACSKPDTCSSNRRGSNQFQINAEVAKYIAKIDIFVQDRSGGRSAREAVNHTIKEAYGTYNDLPPEVKAGIRYLVSQ